jgi:ribonuclease E
VADTVTADEDETDDDDDDTVEPTPAAGGDERETLSRRRRRGRRGGRGRRRTEPGALPAEESTPLPAAREPASAAPVREPAPPPPVRASEAVSRPAAPRTVRTPEPERARIPEVARAAEIEPLPPAREEDDLDDVGRPEGPRDERLESPPWLADLRPSRSEPVPREPERAAEPMQVMAPETFEPPTIETDDEPAETTSSWLEPEPEPEPPASPPASATSTPPPVQYGRRGDRGRRR